MSKLALPKGKKVKGSFRPCDFTTSRGVPYWFGPEWIRNQNGTIGRIVPLKNRNGTVDLHMVSKEGNCTYIQGSIQREFHKWHEDRQIDCILLGMEEDEIIETGWEYV